MSNQKTDTTKSRSRRLLFTGFSMGMADLVPGVSGGTVAFLYGIYDELLYSIRLLTGKVLKLLLQRKIVPAFKAVPFAFLVPVFSGMLIAIVTMVSLVTFALEAYPVQIWSLFFGFIIASAFVISKRVTAWNRLNILVAVIGLMLTYGLVGLPSLSGQLTATTAFTTGAIAICAMILPGISGSLIMVILGQYKNVLEAISSRDLPSILYFVSGAFIGLALFSRLLSWLLKNHHSATIAFLTGVMIGSLRKVWPWQTEIDEGVYRNVSPIIDVGLVIALAMMILGFVIVWKLEKLGVASEHDDLDDKNFDKELKAQHD